MSENESIIKMAAEAGAKAALDTLQKERNKAHKGQKDKRLRNTKLLLKNYRMFKKHCCNAVYKASQINETAIDILDLMWSSNNPQQMMIESIKKSAIRTDIIMQHIDEMLGIYSVVCDMSDKSEDKRRYRVITAMYINNTTASVEEIAITEGIDIRTVYKDIDAACEKLSALIFGIDWLSTSE